MKKIKTRLFVYDDNSHYDQLQGMFDQGWTIKHITPRASELHYILEKEVVMKTIYRKFSDRELTKELKNELLSKGWEFLKIQNIYSWEKNGNIKFNVYVKEVEEN